MINSIEAILNRMSNINRENYESSEKTVKFLPNNPDTKPLIEGYKNKMNALLERYRD